MKQVKFIDVFFSSTCFGYIRPSSGALDVELQRVVFGWVVYGFLLGKPEGRRPLGRPRRRWVDNIRMELQEVGCGYIYGLDWAGPG